MLPWCFSSVTLEHVRSQLDCKNRWLYHHYDFSSRQAVAKSNTWVRHFSYKRTYFVLKRHLIPFMRKKVRLFRIKGNSMPFLLLLPLLFIFSGNAWSDTRVGLYGSLLYNVQTESPLYFNNAGDFDVAHVWGPLQGRQLYAGLKSVF